MAIILIKTNKKYSDSEKTLLNLRDSIPISVVSILGTYGLEIVGSESEFYKIMNIIGIGKKDFDEDELRNIYFNSLYPVNLEDVGYTVLSKTLILKTYVKFKFDTSNIPEGTIIDDNHWPLDAFCFNPEKLIYIKIDSDFAKNEEELELLRLQDFLNSKS
jgi:hypothetical protein